MIIIRKLKNLVDNIFIHLISVISNIESKLSKFGDEIFLAEVYRVLVVTIFKLGVFPITKLTKQRLLRKGTQCLN